MKRIFIVHRWEGNPQEGWYPWLKNELEAKGYEVIVPVMPNPDEPVIEDWVNTLKQTVRTFDENTYFVGHSIGCQTILRTLEKVEKKVGGAVFVAGWFLLSDEVNEDTESYEVAKPWYESFNLGKVKPLIGKSIAIFSDDDPFVPEENIAPFRDKLGSKIIVEPEKGHFSGDDGITELPIVLESILDIMQ